MPRHVIVMSARAHSLSWLGAALVGLALAGCSDAEQPEPTTTPDACAQVSCDTPPQASCDGDVAVTHAAAGTCEDGTCSYQDTRTDCAAAGKLCRNGACLDPADPCAELSCDMPPAPTCEGEVAVTHNAAGTCADGTCSYQDTRTDCAATNQTCSNGVCLNPADPCAQVSCDTPPQASCDGDVAVTHAAAGTCADGTCSYQDTRTDCAATNETCQSGACVAPPDPCENISCDMPPAPTCDGDVAVTHNAAGTCEDGNCSYQDTRTDCAATNQTCSNGVCLNPADPCAQVSCDSPPQASCDGDVAVTHAAGTCQGGTCSYQEMRTDCAANARQCSEGACVDPCAGISCDAPPAPSCDGEVAVTHAAVGMCQAGQCDYQETRTDCAAMDHFCQAGACVDPCAGVSCDMPPAPSCMGNIAITHSDVGMCQGGACSYQESQTDCALTLQSCREGACVTNATLTTGGEHACALLSNNTVVCWGNNSVGQIGDGTETRRRFPTAVSGLSDAVEIAAGSDHTCARRQNNSVVCWGSNRFGGLGDNTLTYRLTPTPVFGLTDAIQIVANAFRSCALRQNNTVVCWGSNSEGHLGDGTYDDRLTPTPVVGLTDAVEIAAGRFHTCARRQNNSVVCWGLNGSGRLGNGTITRSITPSAVLGLTDAIQIATGGQHTCALRQNNTVVCWGDNPYGQLGDGTTIDQLTPTPVLGLSNVVEIIAGETHTCARRQDNVVLCWGRNNVGQLGDGTYITRLVPTPVQGLINGSQLAAAYNHTCARRQDNLIVCWGANNYGQIGDGTQNQQSYPTPVFGL